MQHDDSVTMVYRVKAYLNDTLVEYNFHSDERKRVLLSDSCLFAGSEI